MFEFLSMWVKVWVRLQAFEAETAAPGMIFESEAEECWRGSIVPC